MFKIQTIFANFVHNILFNNAFHVFINGYADIRHIIVTNSLIGFNAQLTKEHPVNTDQLGVLLIPKTAK